MNIPTWNCMIQAYISLKDLDKAIKIAEDMPKFGFIPSSATFHILISACISFQRKEFGERTFQIFKKIPDQSLEIFNSFLNMFNKMHQPEDTIEEFNTFNRVNRVDVISWNCLIQSFIDLKDIERAIEIFFNMQKENFNPTPTTFIILLRGCIENEAFNEGSRIIDLIPQGSINAEVGACMQHFYNKVGKPEKSIEIFEKLKNMNKVDTISWTCFIQSYITLNDIRTAIKMFNIMQRENFKPTSATFVVLLKGCIESNSFREGQEIISSIKQEINTELLNTIMNFYNKCEKPEKAIEEYNKMKSTNSIDVISWNCYIQSHIEIVCTSHHQNFDSAFSVFQQMKQSHIQPTVQTYSILLSGCIRCIAEKRGKEVIEEIRELKYDKEEIITTMMISFYFVIGDHITADSIFQQSLNDGISSIEFYNNMLKCYAEHGMEDKAIKLYEQMISEEIRPDQITFTVILNVFSQCGRYEKAIELYNTIPTKYNQQISIEHKCALIDSLSKVGKFEEIVQIIGNTKDLTIWGVVMSGCRKYNNLEMGERAFEIITKLDETCASAYIQMSQIYSFHGLSPKADSIRNLMHQRNIKITPGIVRHEEKGITYTFSSQNKSHPRFKEIEQVLYKLEDQIIKEGYKPETKCVTNPKYVTEEEKVNSLLNHAEKLAIAHAFLLDPKRKKILLTGNIRVCDDCHSFMSFISKVKNCEIILRDTNRFHYFINGNCSCNKYW